MWVTHLDVVRKRRKAGERKAAATRKQRSAQQKSNDKVATAGNDTWCLCSGPEIGDRWRSRGLVGAPSGTWLCTECAVQHFQSSHCSEMLCYIVKFIFLRNLKIRSMQVSLDRFIKTGYATLKTWEQARIIFFPCRLDWTQVKGTFCWNLNFKRKENYCPMKAIFCSWSSRCEWFFKSLALVPRHRRGLISKFFPRGRGFWYNLIRAFVKSSYLSRVLGSGFNWRVHKDQIKGARSHAACWC